MRRAGSATRAELQRGVIRKQRQRGETPVQTSGRLMLGYVTTARQSSLALAGLERNQPTERLQLTAQRDEANAALLREWERHTADRSRQVKLGLILRRADHNDLHYLLSRMDSQELLFTFDYARGLDAAPNRAGVRTRVVNAEAVRTVGYLDALVRSSNQEILTSVLSELAQRPMGRGNLNAAAFVNILHKYGGNGWLVKPTLAELSPANRRAVREQVFKFDTLAHLRSYFVLKVEVPEK